LLEELGEPIVSSTLILPDTQEPLNDASVIRARLERRIDAVIDAGPCPATPTTVVDLSEPPGTIVRLGLGDPARLGL
jgi:tRNA A37 threonylcarbamoyladenosine synthetase subunit TsaC/SUA5/YrdC